MDLSDVLSNVADQDKGRMLEIIDPWTGTKTGMRFWMAGPDSDTQRRARIAMMDELAEAADEHGKVSATSREKARLNMLARCVLRWEIEEDGKAIAMTHKAVVRVLCAGTWIQAQADAFAGDRANFRPEA
ncbi:hypothetical protein [Martelella radicis]|uniref:Uncharacterized protein n=1 Tax=Martelella radicis TaxID=1397476 RepID=A0A7W6PAX0_9HYPH|nr:hypothetical protein [Martelella radicis]MBB4123295.1 hypothetical protein [Martelella radicis]